MELSKEKCKDNGYIVYLKIGDKLQKSYWSAPPDDINHVDKGYLQDRGYWSITTEKRLKEFKELWIKLWEKKYLLLCNRHNSIFGDNWCLWWGCRESKGGYSSDVRIAHRFNGDEIKEFVGEEDIPVPIEVLGLSDDYEPEETYNKNLCVLIEKGTINKLMGLNLKPLFEEPEHICPKCSSSNVKETYDYDELVYICQDCECEFDENGVEM
jgi:hypothetical protein